MRARASVFVVLVTAGAPDHDLVLLDRDDDGAMPCPVLGVDGIVLDVGVEPEAVALLAVVERALERTGVAAAGATTAADRTATIRNDVRNPMFAGYHNPFAA